MKWINMNLLNFSNLDVKLLKNFMDILKKNNSTSTEIKLIKAKVSTWILTVGTKKPYEQIRKLQKKRNQVAKHKTLFFIFKI